jgi:hypothetical protein
VGLSARGRLLGWILLLGGVAVLASLLVSRQVLLGGVDHEADRVSRLLAAVAALALFLACLTGWAVAGRILAPVSAMRRTAQAITESPGSC